MGRRGPAPTPTQKLALAGSWRADRNKAEPQPEASNLSPPEWVSEEAKACWAEIAPQLDRMGVLKRIDENALARYCQLWSRWKAAELFIARHGETYPIKDGQGNVKYIQQLPQVAIASKLAQQLTRLEQEFGMTPSARTRIEVDMPSAVTDKSRFFETGA